jgi:peptidoglycan/xylan/chitin deacetylase (PgdA/CDA1 family)
VSAGTAHIVASASGISSTPSLLTVLGAQPTLTTIAVTPFAASIFTGGTQQFAAVGYDQFANPMSGLTFAWASSNPGAATINGGLASGHAEGTAQITASAQGVTGNAALLSIAKPPSVLTSIRVSPEMSSIQAGGTQQLSVAGSDQYGAPITGLTFVWSSTNAGVAAVRNVNAEGVNAGLATALSAGTVQIAASAQGIISNSVALTVTAPPPPPPPPVVSAISLMASKTTLNVGEAQRFSAFATDQYGAAMSEVSFTWTSSDPSVAAIDENGLATGLAAGSVQVSASAQGVANSTSLTVVVPQPPIPIAVTRLSPPIALVGSGDLTPLTITGTGFIPGAVVNFGSNVLIPSSVTPTSIVVTVPAAELTTAATVSVSVTDPAPNAGTSGALPFTITSSGFVSINFDDGYQSMYDNGLPIFDAAGLKTTQYIITENVGTDSYVTWDEVQTMLNNGHEIGNHTRTHPFLTTLTQTGMQDEIVGAQQDFQQHGLTPVTVAYPYGDYDERVEAVVKAAGFRGARSSDLGYDCNLLFTSESVCLRSDDPLFLESQAAEADMNTTISNITGWIDYAVANKLWLIILLHRVDEDGNPISVPHELLQQTADYLVQQKVVVVTNSEGMIIENLDAQAQPPADGSGILGHSSARRTKRSN